MRILALIPARGGSKRLPGKNVKILGGKPLINWSIESANGIAEICDILVATSEYRNPWYNEENQSKLINENMNKITKGSLTNKEKNDISAKIVSRYYSKSKPFVGGKRKTFKKIKLIRKTNTMKNKTR